MSTRKDFVASFTQYIYANRRSAYLLESRIHRCWRLSKLNLTESAFSSFFMFFMLQACFTQMIWLMLALRAKVLLTITASYSVLAHMNSCFPAFITLSILTLKQLCLDHLFVLYQLSPIPLPSHCRMNKRLNSDFKLKAKLIAV